MPFLVILPGRELTANNLPVFVDAVHQIHVGYVSPKNHVSEGCLQCDRNCQGCQIPVDGSSFFLRSEKSVFLKFNVYYKDGWSPPEMLQPAMKHRSVRECQIKDQKQIVDLGECLDNFTKEEVLSKEDAWYCSQCKDFRRARKRMGIWKVPEILIIHLKRFSSAFRKLDTKIHFPSKGFKMNYHTSQHQIRPSKTFQAHNHSEQDQVGSLSPRTDFHQQQKIPEQRIKIEQPDSCATDQPKQTVLADLTSTASGIELNNIAGGTSVPACRKEDMDLVEVAHADLKNAGLVSGYASDSSTGSRGCKSTEDNDPSRLSDSGDSERGAEYKSSKKKKHKKHKKDRKKKNKKHKSEKKKSKERKHSGSRHHSRSRGRSRSLSPYHGTRRDYRRHSSRRQSRDRRHHRRHSRSRSRSRKGKSPGNTSSNGYESKRVVQLPQEKKRGSSQYGDGHKLEKPRKSNGGHKKNIHDAIVETELQNQGDHKTNDTIGMRNTTTSSDNTKSAPGAERASERQGPSTTETHQSTQKPLSCKLTNSSPQISEGGNGNSIGLVSSEPATATKQMSATSQSSPTGATQKNDSAYSQAEPVYDLFAVSQVSIRPLFFIYLVKKCYLICFPQLIHTHQPKSTHVS